VINISKTFSVACFILVLETCTVNVKPGFIDEDKQAAEKEIDKFHLQFSNGDFKTIYNNASASFQKAMDTSVLFAIMKNNHDQFGDFKVVVDKRLNVIIETPVQIRAVYISKFSKTDLTEMFIFIKDNDNIKLEFYKPYQGRSILPAQ